MYPVIFATITYWYVLLFFLFDQFYLCHVSFNGVPIDTSPKRSAVHIQVVAHQEIMTRDQTSLTVLLVFVFLARQLGSKKTLFQLDAKNFFLVLTFFLSPFSLFFSLPFCVNRMIGFRTDAAAFFLYVCITVLCANCGHAIGLFIGVLAPDAAIGINISPIFIFPMMVFSGFLINENSVPDYFIWIPPISWIQYGFNALIVNEVCFVCWNFISFRFGLLGLVSCRSAWLWFFMTFLFGSLMKVSSLRVRMTKRHSWDHVLVIIMV